MKSYYWKIILMFGLLVSLIFPASANSQNIALVDSESAKIYEEPGPANSHFAMAQKGDLFEIESLDNGWVGIKMFSGKVRYLKLIDIDIQFSMTLGQDNFSKRLKLCDDIQNILDEATEEADSSYPEDKMNSDLLKNKLIDKRVLSLFRKSNVPAIHNSIFLDCANDSLIPISDS